MVSFLFDLSFFFLCFPFLVIANPPGNQIISKEESTTIANANLGLTNLTHYLHPKSYQQHTKTELRIRTPLPPLLFSFSHKPTEKKNETLKCKPHPRKLNRSLNHQQCTV
ncbi:hypothetical protein AAHE18_04G113900 [Arachis hypogaea]